MREYKKRYDEWMRNPYFDKETKEELKAMTYGLKNIN